MCGRYAITLPPEAVRESFKTHGDLPNWPPYYNAAPTTALPVVRQSRNGQRELALMTWGKFAAQFHNRMPLVLEPDAWDLWMKAEPDLAVALMKPANEDVLTERPVSKAVNNVKNNGPDFRSPDRLTIS